MSSSVCKFNLSGSCRNGKLCSFSHQRTVPRQNAAKKVACRYFPKGTCAYGDQCSRAHVLPESDADQTKRGGKPVRASNRGNDGDAPANTGSTNYNRVVDALNSQSEYLDDATSNHERQDDDESNVNPNEESHPQPLSSVPPSRDTFNSSDEEKPQCVFFLQGVCESGDTCVFLHSVPGKSHTDVVHGPNKSESTRAVCQYFQRGFCRLKDKCKNIHESPNKASKGSNQPSESDSSPASGIQSPVFGNKVLQAYSSASDTQMQTPTGHGDYIHQWEDDQEKGSQFDEEEEEWEGEQDAEEVLKDPPQIYHRAEIPLDSNGTIMNQNEDVSGQWKGSFSNTGRSSPDISQGLEQKSEQEPVQSGDSRKRKRPGSYYGEGWSEEEVGSPRWPIPTATSQIPEENIPIPTQPVYPHISEVKPHWSQFADPYADPKVPFCKFHAQGQCTQGFTCKFRHSLTPHEYTTLFHDQQPNLWTLKRNSLNDNVAPTTIARTTHAYELSTSFVQPPFGAPSLTPRPSASTSRQECLFYPRGKCQNGENCPFKHIGPPPPTIPAPKSEPDDSKPYKSSINYNSKVCKYFANGRCKMGSDCKFVHEEVDSNHEKESEELDQRESATKQADADNGWGRPWDETPNDADWNDNPIEGIKWDAPPDLSGWDITSTSDNKLEKQTCNQFTKYGTCRFQDSCKFAHDVEPNESTPTIEEKKTPVETLQHSDNDEGYSPPGTRTDSPVSLCPYFFKGRCKNEEICEFSHGNPQPHLNQARLNQTVSERSITPGQSNDHEEVENGEEEEQEEQQKEEEEEELQDNERQADVEQEQLVVAEEISNDAPMQVAKVQSKILKPCRYFIQGHCKDGLNCRFAHDNASGDIPDEIKPNDNDIIEESGETAHLEASAVGAGGTNEQFTVDSGRIDQDEFPDQALEPIFFDHPLVTRLLLSCEVTVGPDSAPSQITTMSDSTKIILSDLPDSANAQGIREFCSTFGQVNNAVNINTTSITPVFQVEFAEISHAIRAAKSIGKHLYHGKKIIATLKARVPLTITDANDQLVLKVSWPNPSQSAWSHYPTITKAKQEAARLNNITFRGRTIKATFVTPHRSQKDLFAIKIDRLPVDVTKAELEQICTNTTLVTLNQPTYTEDSSNAIRSALDECGGLETFDPLAGNSERAIAVAFAIFQSDSMAKAAMKSLDSQEQNYLGNQSVTLRPVYYSRYRVLRDQLEAIQNELYQIQAESDRRCSVQIDDHHDTTLAWIRMYASPEVGPRFHAELKDLVSGTILKAENGCDLWDDYFELSSSSKALKQINNAFIHRDLRTKQLKAYGSLSERDEAQKLILKLLSKVHSQRHQITLPRPKLKPLINGSLAILKTELGFNKVSLDVIKSTLIVRGSSDDVSKAHAILDSLNPNPSSSSKHTSCQICLHTPTPDDSIGMDLYSASHIWHQITPAKDALRMFHTP
uniref:C3H1-type domain-containing protein n=1 Tax=Psilocybe cubensis TaxID=181762 RepID=A0A8H7XVM1_PSICU